MYRYRNVIGALGFLILGVLATPAWAKTRVVDQDGFASAKDCDALTPAFLSIGSVLSAAVNNDKIVVCPGSGPYAEQLVIDKAITLKGFELTNVVIQPTSAVANTSSLFNGAPIAASSS